MVPVLIDWMKMDPGGYLTLVSIMVWNRYRLQATNLGRAATGMSRPKSCESAPRLVYGALTATSMSTRTPIFDPEAQAYGNWLKKSPARKRGGSLEMTCEPSSANE
jgi:hypothetical protein